MCCLDAIDNSRTEEGERDRQRSATVVALAGSMPLPTCRPGAPYRSGRSSDWIKVKNLDRPAMQCEREGRW
jgi:hypothetical protein